MRRQNLQERPGWEGYHLFLKKDSTETETQSGFWVLQPNAVTSESLGRIYPHGYAYYILPVIS